MIIQSNSIRGEFMRNIVDTTIKEILSDISCMFGPGATDAFITKDDQIYYTRDGKEVMESLMFDNELASKVHHIMYQAAYHQGRNVGDGSTTLIILYCNIYLRMRRLLSSGSFTGTINDVRKVWSKITTSVIEKLKAQSVPLTEENMLSMFYTCTQDADLSVKLYDKLRDAILAGAYIVPRKSNIASDFEVNIHNRPTVKVTKMFSLKPIPDTCNDAVVLYCNGSMDIAHPEVLMSIAGRMMYRGEWKVDATIILLCHGITEATRRSTREFVRAVKSNGYDVSMLNNIAIYTMDDYRKMDKEEIEDISTILCDENGIGGLVSAITFEHLLYNAFETKSIMTTTAPVYGEIPVTDPRFDAKIAINVSDYPDKLNITFGEYGGRIGDVIYVGNNRSESYGKAYIVTGSKDIGGGIDDLEKFDVDLHSVTKMRDMLAHPYEVLFDAIDGMAISKELGPIASARYNQLLEEIAVEKSPVRRNSLNARLRRSYGMFIDIEVGSNLLKDSQRKFELILDAIISGSTAAKEQVLNGNSVLHAARELSGITESPDMEYKLSSVLWGALVDTMYVLCCNYYGSKEDANACCKLIEDAIGDREKHAIEDFNITNGVCNAWPEKGHAVPLPTIPVTVNKDTDEERVVEVPPCIVEPLGSISAILTNSILPVEIAMSKVYHLSGRTGFMGNYLGKEDD